MFNVKRLMSGYRTAKRYLYKIVADRQGHPWGNVWTATPLPVVADHGDRKARRAAEARHRTELRKQTGVNYAIASIMRDNMPHSTGSHRHNRDSFNPPFSVPYALSAAYYAAGHAFVADEREPFTEVFRLSDYRRPPMDTRGTIRRRTEAQCADMPWIGPDPPRFGGLWED